MVNQLWQAWEKRVPEVADATLLEAADSNSRRLSHVFKKSGVGQDDCFRWHQGHMRLCRADGLAALLSLRFREKARISRCEKVRQKQLHAQLVHIPSLIIRVSLAAVVSAIRNVGGSYERTGDFARGLPGGWALRGNG